jgi:hypothetical protein
MAASAGDLHGARADKEHAMRPTLTATTQLESTTPLDDQCDRCGVSAKLYADLAGGGALAFCGHHANEYAANLAGLASRIAVEPGFEWWGLPAES